MWRLYDYTIKLISVITHITCNYSLDTDDLRFRLPGPLGVLVSYKHCIIKPESYKLLPLLLLRPPPPPPTVTTTAAGTATTAKCTLYLSRWSELQVWPQGSLVKHVRGLFKAEGLNNSAEPGNSMHSRFYVSPVFSRPGTQACTNEDAILHVSCA